MVGRYAIEHPWVFREARALIDRGEVIAEPTPSERIGLCREHLTMTVEERGALRAVRAMRRYYPGYLKGLPGSAAIRRELNLTDDLAAVFGIFDRLDEMLAKRAA